MNEKINFTFPEFNGAGETSRAAQSRRELLESTKLSRLPKLPPRRPFSLDKIPDPTLTICRICEDGKLEKDNQFQQSVKICRECLARHAKTGAVLDEHADEKARAAKLQKFALAMER